MEFNIITNDSFDLKTNIHLVCTHITNNMDRFDTISIDMIIVVWISEMNKGVINIELSADKTNYYGDFEPEKFNYRKKDTYARDYLNKSGALQMATAIWVKRIWSSFLSSQNSLLIFCRL